MSKQILTSNKPHIFIGGCSRSGTTLLGAMLGAHPNLVCTPESHFKIDVLRSDAWQEGQIDLTQTTELIRRHWRFKLWDFELDPTAVPGDKIGRSYPCLLDHIVSAYAQHIDKPAADIWVDHTPENISYADTLLELFPRAKFIHIVRDGRAVAASIMPLDWGPNTIIKASRWWMRMTSFGLAAEHTLGPQCVMRVRYEDLVFRPEKTLKQLCEFLEITYHPDMKSATGFTPPNYTTGQHTLIGQQPQASLATRWEKRLSSRQIEIFENLTRDFMTFLDYPLRYGIKAQAPTFIEVQRGKAKELIQGEILNKFKWLVRSYPIWLSPDFRTFASLSDTNN